MKVPFLVHSIAQTEYENESSMSHEPLALVRPYMPFLPVEGSSWRSSLFFPLVEFVGQYI